MVAESDESPIYNIVYSTKIRISIDGREEIRTLLHLLKMKFTSIESPINIHVLRLYVFIKRGTDARRFELLVLKRTPRLKPGTLNHSVTHPLKTELVNMYIYVITDMGLEPTTVETNAFTEHLLYQ